MHFHATNIANTKKKTFRLVSSPPIYIQYLQIYIYIYIYSKQSPLGHKFMHFHATNIANTKKKLSGWFLALPYIYNTYIYIYIQSKVHLARSLCTSTRPILPTQKKKLSGWFLTLPYTYNTYIYTYIYLLIHAFSSLSYDRSKASSKASSPHSAIENFLPQMRVSSPFLYIYIYIYIYFTRCWAAYFMYSVTAEKLTGLLRLNTIKIPSWREPLVIPIDVSCPHGCLFVLKAIWWSRNYANSKMQVRGTYLIAGFGQV